MRMSYHVNIINNIPIFAKHARNVPIALSGGYRSPTGNILLRSRAKFCLFNPCQICYITCEEDCHE